MLLLGQLLTAAGSAWVFWHWVGLDHLTQVFQTLTSAVSILIAAVFVRLNRGLPTIDWKVISANDRRRITSALVRISIDYVGVLAIGVLTLVAIVVLGAVDPIWVSALPIRCQSGISAVMGFLFSVLLFRMGYVVWRDLDIVRLQKKVIDGIEAKEQSDALNEAVAKRAREEAADKLEAMKRSGLRADPTRVSKL